MDKEGVDKEKGNSDSDNLSERFLDEVGRKKELNFNPDNLGEIFLGEINKKKRDRQIAVWVPAEFHHMVGVAARQEETTISNYAYQCLLIGHNERSADKYKEVVALNIQDKDRMIQKAKAEIARDMISEAMVAIGEAKRLRNEGAKAEWVVKYYIIPIIKSFEEIKDIDITDIIDELKELANSMTGEDMFNNEEVVENE